MTSAAASDRAGAIDAATRVAKLFERHGRMVYGVCRAMLRDTHDAEDATQQTFLSAHRALLGGARVRDEGAWLATIARNECRARIAAGMRRPLVLGDDDLALIADPGDETERRLLAEALRTALADLPERQREAVVLRDLYGLRYGELAKALGLSRPATEALLFRARRAMRQRLRPVVTTALVVPLSVQEGLAQALPGFAVTGSGAAIAGAASGGLLAKLAAAPAAAKFATAAVAVTTVGAVGTVESERVGRDRAERPAIVSVASTSSDDDSGSDSSGKGNSNRHEDVASGSGSSKEDEHGKDKSGSAEDEGRDESGTDGSSGRGRGADDDAAASGQGSEAEDGSGDDNSGRGSGSDDGVTSSTEEPESSGPSDPSDDSEPSDDPAEPDSSGKGSGGDDSSGKGSDDDSSGKGSGGDASSGGDPEDD